MTNYDIIVEKFKLKVTKEKEKEVMNSIENYSNYEDFCKNSEFAKSLNDDELDSLDYDFLESSNVLRKIEGKIYYLNMLKLNMLDTKE